MPSAEDVPEFDPDEEASSGGEAEQILPPASTFRLVLGAMALQAGTAMLTRAIDRNVMGGSKSGVNAPKPGKIHGLASKKLAGIAGKSIPGAIAVSGGLLAKHIFDRGGQRLKAKRAARKSR